MRKQLLKIGALTCLLILFFGVGNAFAQSHLKSWFDSINFFQSQVAPHWQHRAFIVSSVFFGLFVTIQGCLYGYRLISSKYATDIDKLKRKFGIIIGLYLLLLVFNQLDTIIYGLRDIAMFITGRNEQISEMGVITEGFSIAFNAGNPWQDSAGIWSYMTSTWINFLTGGGYILASWAVIIAYVIMAIQYAYVTIEIMILLAIGPIPLAFGGIESWRGIAVSYIKLLFETGLKLFFFYIMFGVAKTILSNVATIENNGWSIIGIGDAWAIMVEVGFVAVLVATLLIKLPGPLAKKLVRHFNPNFEKLF